MTRESQPLMQFRSGLLMHFHSGVDSHLAKKKAVHGKQYIGDTVAYVRKGKRNNFN